MPKPPEAIEQFKQKYPDVSKAFAQLAAECHKSGPLDEKSRRLVKLALAVGAGLEGATHSAVRHALELGVSQEELVHVAVLGITTLGWPSAMRALTWIGDSKPRD